MMPCPVPQTLVSNNNNNIINTHINDTYTLDSILNCDAEVPDYFSIFSQFIHNDNNKLSSAGMMGSVPKTSSSSSSLSSQSSSASSLFSQSSSSSSLSSFSSYNNNSNIQLCKKRSLGEDVNTINHNNNDFDCIFGSELAALRSSTPNTSKNGNISDKKSLLPSFCITSNNHAHKSQSKKPSKHISKKEKEQEEDFERDEYVIGREELQKSIESSSSKYMTPKTCSRRNDNCLSYQQSTITYKKVDLSHQQQQQQQHAFSRQKQHKINPLTSNGDKNTTTADEFRLNAVFNYSTGLFTPPAFDEPLSSSSTSLSFQSSSTSNPSSYSSPLSASLPSRSSSSSLTQLKNRFDYFGDSSDSSSNPHFGLHTELPFELNVDVSEFNSNLCSIAGEDYNTNNNNLITAFEPKTPIKQQFGTLKFPFLEFEGGDNYQVPRMKRVSNNENGFAVDSSTQLQNQLHSQKQTRLLGSPFQTSRVGKNMCL